MFVLELADGEISIWETDLCFPTREEAEAIAEALRHPYHQKWGREQSQLEDRLIRAIFGEGDSGELS